MKICFMQKLTGMKIFQVTIKADYVVMKNRKARDTVIFSQLRFHFLKTVGGDISTSYSVGGVISGFKL